MADTNESLPGEIAPLALAASQDMVRAYAELTDDFNPIHVDPAFAAGTPFGGLIAHGTMALNLLLVAAERGLGRPVGGLEIRFVKPVPVGATIRAGGRLADAARGTYEVFVETDAGVRALEGTLTVGKAP